MKHKEGHSMESVESLEEEISEKFKDTFIYLVGKGLIDKEALKQVANKVIMDRVKELSARSKLCKEKRRRVEEILEEEQIGLFSGFFINETLDFNFQDKVIYKIFRECNGNK